MLALIIITAFTWPDKFHCYITPEPGEVVVPYFIGETVCRPGTECIQPYGQWTCVDSQLCHDQYDAFFNDPEPIDPLATE